MVYYSRLVLPSGDHRAASGRMLCNISTVLSQIDETVSIKHYRPEAAWWSLLGRAKRLYKALAALVIVGIPKPTTEKNVEAILKREGDGFTIEQLIEFAIR